MHMVTVDCWRHIAAGHDVDDGFGGVQTAPAVPGYYTLYELVSENNTHEGFEWKREDA